MKSFNGNVLFLDRSDINTDEIIPAKYLTEITKDALRPYLLEDLKLDGFDPSRDLKGKAAVVSRANFGCGSSREHAPWALEVNGIHVVIAENFAPIFRPNTHNCGLPPTELPKATIDKLFATYKGKDTTLSVDVENAKLTFTSGGTSETVGFTLGGFDKALVQAEGWVGYADRHY